MVADDRKTIAVWQVIAFIGVLGVVCEAAWQLRYHVASPARGLLFVLLAVCIGNPLREWALGAGRARGLTVCFGAGFVAMGVVYLVLRGLHAPRGLIVGLLVMLAVYGAWRGRWRGLLVQRIDVLSLLIGLTSVLLCARAEWFAELPQLTLRHPTVFAGIDTPLWLNLAYGLERSVPPRELLFANEVLNYHYGSGLLPLLMRATTGMPMHVAHSASVAICGIAPALMIGQLMQRLFAADRTARRFLAWMMPPFACLGFQLWVFNLPSACGNFLLVFALLELLRASRWRSMWLTVPTFLLLMLTKEVAYLAALLCAGCVGLAALYRSRDWRPLARLLLAFVATRLLYAPLTHPDQKVSTTLFRERLELAWLWNELRETSVIEYTRVLSAWIVAAALLAVLVCILRRRWSLAATLSASTFVFLTMTMLAMLVRPEFDPPLDPLHAHWALKDMFQFHKLGGHIALLSLFAAGVVASVRLPFVRTDARAVSLATAVGAAWFAEDHYFRVAPPHPGQEHEEYRGDNAIVPVLAKIPARRSLIAADQLNWNGENPHWAAFFGHRFYCLRRVRWAPAYERYAEVVGNQDAIFRAGSFAEVASIARGEAITHVIVDKLRPTAWAAQARPAIETDRYIVYTF